MVSSCSGRGRLVSFVSSGGVRIEFVAVEFLAFTQEASANVCRARMVDGAEGAVQRVCLCTARVWFRAEGVARLSRLQVQCAYFSSRSLKPFLFCLGDHAEVNADIDTCRSDDARLLSGWACDRIAYRMAGLPRFAHSLFSCGTLFVLCDMWHLARFSAGHQHPSVGVVLTLV